MSFVQATPEFVAAAATDLARIGSTISSANTAALGPTSGVLAPGADEVSASIAALFDAHSQVYQALSAQAAAFHSQFVQLMNGGALQYAVTEAANTTPLQSAAGPASVAAQLPAVSGAVGGSAPTAPAAPWRRRWRRRRRGTPAGRHAGRGGPAGSATLASATARPAGRVATPRTRRPVPVPVQPAASSAPAPAGTPRRPRSPSGAADLGRPALPVSARPAPHAPAQAQPATAPVRRVPIVPPESG
ncbi:PE family protein [Mycobacterium sp. MAC_080597_8934]|uniref:PE family protein n=1 Tax=Mycobacterium sp. MAC_080597_8934 TaxID=1335322 RepID=UPI00044A586D|nr:PE family protein [Mycobacterium sp. MAC_080597_8934]ETZ64635.1 PE family protein [Mycobacterium sp. MAC_080597_8934]